MRAHPRLLLCLALASPHVVGCGDDDAPRTDGGVDDGGIRDDADVLDDGGPDGGPPDDDAGPNDAGVPDALRVERIGGRLRGRPLALSIAQDFLWVGTSTLADPSNAGVLRGGLGRLDLARGTLDVIEDALPRVGDGIDVGPASTAEALTIDGTTYVVSQGGLLAVEGETVRVVPITDAAGEPLTAFHLAHDATRERLWVGTNGGLVVLDADEAIVRRVGADVLGAPQIGGLAADPVHGAAFAIVVRDDFTTRLVRVSDAGALTNAIEPGTGGVPEGFVRDLAFDADLNGVYFTLSSWEPTRGGLLSWHPSAAGPTVDVLLTEGELATAARGEAIAFGATRLLLDTSADLVVIGGQLRPAGPLASPEGGGLVFAKLSSLGTEAPELYGLSAGTSTIAGDHVTDIAYDAARGRFYVALQQACNETRLGNAGVWAIRFEDGRPVFELPWLSGVRDLAIHDGQVLAAIRDDVPGYRCEGLTVQVGLVRVRADGTGTIVPLAEGGRGETLPTTRRGLTEIAVRGDAVAVTGYREDTWFGTLDDGRWAAGPLELGISLFPQALAWETGDVVWVGGTAVHSSGDPESLADVGPRGVARVTLGANGSIESHVQYVRGVREPSEGVIPGLPSSEVVEVLPMTNGRAWIVMGAERVRDGGSDRDDDYPVFSVGGAPRLGGVAIVDFDGEDDREGTADDHTIVEVAGAPELPDPRAAALHPDGTSLLVIDATRGLVRIDESLALHVLALPFTPSSPHVVHATEGAQVVGGAEGAWVTLADGAADVRDVGHVWSALRREDGVLYLGSDEGLVRVTTLDGTWPDEPSVPAGEDVPFGGRR